MHNKILTYRKLYTKFAFLEIIYLKIVRQKAMHILLNITTLLNNTFVHYKKQFIYWHANDDKCW